MRTKMWFWKQLQRVLIEALDDIRTPEQNQLRKDELRRAQRRIDELLQQKSEGQRMRTPMDSGDMR